MDEGEEEEIKQRCRIDERLDSYKQFFDKERARRLGKLTDATKLERPVLALTGSWKAVNNTLRLPYHLVAFVETWGRVFANNVFAKRFTALLAEELGGAMAHLIDKKQLFHLNGAIHERSQRLQGLDAASKKAVNKYEVWKELTNENDPACYGYLLAIWGSQRIGYGAIIHAFEAFQRECLAIAENDPLYSTQKGFKANFKKHFGDEVYQDCVEDGKMKIARIVRNSLAHNDGEVPDDLPADHGIAILDNRLQIMAEDSRRLMHLLQDKAQRLSGKALSLPQFT